jgi:hypothetical protein
LGFTSIQELINIAIKSNNAIIFLIDRCVYIIRSVSKISPQIANIKRKIGFFIAIIDMATMSISINNQVKADISVFLQ